jgi:hypothetical protein
MKNGTFFIMDFFDAECKIKTMSSAMNHTVFARKRTVKEKYAVFQIHGFT